MAKSKSIYSCTECGGQTLKWQGQCPYCQLWNTLVETVAEKSSTRFTHTNKISKVENLEKIKIGEEPRYLTGITEFDRVLGGGLVHGGIILLGGDPGIGKSTLLLQALSYLSDSLDVLYVSGEESARQIALRAKRLSLVTKDVHLLTEIQLERIQEVLIKINQM